MTRSRPAWWYRLPVAVDSAATLAAHVRETAAQCGGSSTDWPQQALLTTAELLEACPPADATCLQSVVAALDARAAGAPEDSLSGERRYWDALARAVDRIAGSLAVDSDGRNTLSDEFDTLFARMQQPSVREGTMRGIKATPAEMGDAAHRAAKRAGN